MVVGARPWDGDDSEVFRNAVHAAPSLLKPLNGPSMTV